MHCCSCTLGCIYTLEEKPENNASGLFWVHVKHCSAYLSSKAIGVLWPFDQSWTIGLYKVQRASHNQWPLFIATPPRLWPPAPHTCIFSINPAVNTLVPRWASLMAHTNTHRPGISQMGSTKWIDERVSNISHWVSMRHFVAVSLSWFINNQNRQDTWCKNHSIL